jgi:hypothetical protein
VLNYRFRKRLLKTAAGGGCYRPVLDAIAELIGKYANLRAQYGLPPIKGSNSEFKYGFYLRALTRRIVVFGDGAPMTKGWSFTTIRIALIPNSFSVLKRRGISKVRLRLALMY